jgi:GTP-binding protein
MEFIIWAGKNQIPLVLCFTKTDKLTDAQLQYHLDIYRKRLHEAWEDLPDFIITSTVKRKGRQELAEIIDRSNKLMHEGV